MNMPSRNDVLKSAGRSACSLPSESDDIQMMAVSWYASDEIPRSADTESGSGGSSDEENGAKEEAEAEADEGGKQAQKKPYIPRQYTVKVFGVTSDGASVCVTLTDFMPYFYVRVAAAWGRHGGARLRDWLAEVKGVASAKLLQRKDYMGFHNGETCGFVRVKFAQQFAMRRLSNKLMEGLTLEGADLDLAHIGIPHSGRMKVYESNIDPMLRLMHHQQISPAGWVVVRSGKWTENSVRAESNCQLDIQCTWSDLHCLAEKDEIAPMVVFSLDIECGSSHGDFPQAKKGLNKLGMELTQTYSHCGLRARPLDEQLQAITSCLRKAFGLEYEQSSVNSTVSRIFPKAARSNLDLPALAQAVLAEVRVAAGGKMGRTAIERVTDVLTGFFPRPRMIREVDAAWGSAVPDPPGVLQGDPVIQIGVTMHVYGDKSCCQRHILTLGTCEAIEGTQVHQYANEASLLLGFSELMRDSDPDILIGYNQFGFDFAYMNSRAEELGVSEEFGVFGRLKDVTCSFKKQTLSSSALGDNELRYFDITGRCQIDIMKVVQREHKLDSFKLDAVAEHFMGMHKNDISPNDIFRLQLGTAADRRVIAEYCVQDCALCNHLLMKLEIIANNVGMANVCSVPLSFLFLRGQGIKVQSLVARRCLAEGFLIPTIRYTAPTAPIDGIDQQEEGYEGAIVLEPETGLYLTEPVSVLDFASLYPSSMISGNLSHDTYVMDERYDNLPGVEYEEVRYDVRDENGVRLREEVCRFAKSATGILPMILRDLLSARKATRAKIKALGKVAGADPFLLAVLDGQQLAFKVTANSLYGQMGARTSALYLKQIAACTTAIGRAMIMKAKAFLETEHRARVIYGDTDSVFAVFPNMDTETGKRLEGRNALMASIAEGVKASAAFRLQLPSPHDLEYEKTFFPFFLLSKKRYVGKKYELSADKSEVSSMGLVTKRRDNAPIVKTIYGGIIDILLERQDVPEAERFLKRKLTELVQGDIEIEELVVSKALKGFYKAPDTIAHYVLARRMGDRDPGSKPQVNDRVPYVYIVAPRKLLQGERIENPKYVKTNGIPIDTTHYVTNQIMKPVLQLMSLALEKLTGYSKDKTIARGLKKVIESGGNVAMYRETAVKRLLFDTILATKQVLELEKKRQRIGAKSENIKNGQTELTDYFHLSEVSAGCETGGVSIGRRGRGGGSNIGTAATASTGSVDSQSLCSPQGKQEVQFEEDVSDQV